MTGAGNDFVVIDNKDGRYTFEWSSVAPFLCNRRYGVGADGLIIIEKSFKANFRMNYYNADGSYGGMCGNGGRCSALFVMGQLNRREVSFEALDYIYNAAMPPGNDRLQLRMKDPHSIALNININIFNEMIVTHFVNTGSPHVILFMDELPKNIFNKISTEGIAAVGKEIRNHKDFLPDGTNVNFATVMENNTIAMRTYERGVEDETLACGTGSVATAIITSLVKGYTAPITIKTRSNENVLVTFDKEGEGIKNVVLEGPAKIVFKGSMEVPEMID
jgi:diaminopimelate epimerase